MTITTALARHLNALRERITNTTGPRTPARPGPDLPPYPWWGDHGYEMEEAGSGDEDTFDDTDEDWDPWAEPVSVHEQSVVVVFDLYADTHTDAARRVADLLRRGGECDVLDQPDVDAWWFPEPGDKAVDGNDRDAMVLRALDQHRPDPDRKDTAMTSNDAHTADDNAADQGVTAIVAALLAQNIPVAVAQRDGFSVIATVVDLPDQHVLALTWEDSAVLVVDHTPEQWARTVDVPDEATRRFADATAAVAWVRQRMTEAEAAAAISKVGVIGGWIRVADRDPLHLDEAGNVVRALTDAGFRITHAA